MLRTIDTVSDDLALGCADAAAVDGTGFVIKKEQLAVRRRANDLVGDAHAHAEALLAQARAHAQEYCEAGLRQGMEMGVQAALVPMMNMLEALQATRDALREQACHAAQAAMRDFLAQAPSLVALFDTVMSSHLSAQASPLRITVPACADVSALSAHCAALGLQAQIQVSENDGVFSAGWDGHLWEVHVASLFGPVRVGDAGQPFSVPDRLAREMCRDVLLRHAQQLVDPIG